MVAKERARNSRNYEICHLDEAFEPRIVLDVKSVELDTVSPRERVRLEEVLDLVIVNVQGEYLVWRLRHQFLAKVRANEASGSNHAYRYRLYWPPVQIHSRCHLKRYQFSVIF